jgi:hypothetical protein
MKVLTKTIKFILVTILTICLISIGIISIVSSTILDKTYITEKMEETNFYKETYELVKSNFEKYIYQSGLDEEVLENICTEEKLQKDINTIISNIYDGTDEKIDTTEIETNLNSNIDKLGIKNSKNQKAIEQFVKHICDEYTETIIHTKYESQINTQYQKVINLLTKVQNVIIIILIIDAILLIIMNIKTASKIIQDLGIALFSSSIFKLSACFIIMSKVNIEGIKILNDTFSKTLVTIITDVLTKIMSLGIGALLIAIILIIIYAIISVNKKNEEETTDK